ncbi:MAG: VOC family protein [Actinomycetota bacterium]|nr:VOC family protein [Actinomycetota bacterium]
MPKFESYDPGTPCWVDLMSPDVDASVAFYGDVFGWSAEPSHDGDGNHVYTNFLLGGLVVAGMGAQPAEMAGAPGVWNTYICVDDLAAVTKKVTSAGGSVMMPPMDVMDVGSMAVCADPTGAVFSVWKPAAHKGAAVANEANTWSWNELVTRDVGTARSFYATVFDWEYDTQDMPMGPYHVIRGGEHGGLGGMMTMPPHMPDMVPNHWMVYFTTSDLDATLARITGGGGQVVSGPDDAPGVGRIAIAHDPHGASFALLQPAG